MIQLHLQHPEELKELIHSRDGETKVGKLVTLCTSLDDLATSSGRYVIFGICEDIGVLANYGNTGARKAWKSFLNAFVNTQVNAFNEPSQIILLGKVSVSPDLPIRADTAKSILGDIVHRIDKKITAIVQRIVEAGKIPIIIGGGHNNAYGNLKGVTAGLKKPINCINIDAHTDLRACGYRHSGNGFTYALQDPEGPFLAKYAIFGLHKNYTPQYVLDFIKDHNTTNGERIIYDLIEDMLFTNEQQETFKKAATFITDACFGIELDCDSISNFPSSAQSPSGFALDTVRSFITQLAQSPHCTYFHICEAAPTESNSSQVGKALSYLVTDFIRSHREHNPI